jgi:hypothetical protein
MITKASEGKEYKRLSKLLNLTHMCHVKENRSFLLSILSDSDTDTTSAQAY